jgi:hypothetical protein
MTISITRGDQAMRAPGAGLATKPRAGTGTKPRNSTRAARSGPIATATPISQEARNFGNSLLKLFGRQFNIDDAGLKTMGPLVRQKCHLWREKILAGDG